MIVYLNGQFLPLQQASISPLDRGFLFADGVYEVIPVYQGQAFLLDAHLARLRRSLAAIQLQDPFPEDEWRKLLAELVSHNPGDDRSIYLQITRGVAPRDHLFPANVSPTVFASVQPIKTPGTWRERAAAAITLPDQRWGRCDIKSVALLANVLVKQEAAQRGASEAIMLRSGMVTEGSASNVFVCHGDRVTTPPLGPQILAGVTRGLVLELLGRLGMSVTESPITEEELRNASEIWLTSSTKEIFPVIRLDDHVVGDGEPGPLGQRVCDLYQAEKATATALALRKNHNHSADVSELQQAHGHTAARPETV